MVAAGRIARMFRRAIPAGPTFLANGQTEMSAPPIRCLMAAVVVLWAWSSAVAGADQRLNVLWICADDHAPYVMGAYGNRRVRTPHLDRLAAGGIRFDRAFCNSPICTASRQSFITGRYPRTVGVTRLETALPENELTLAGMLKQAGYETASFGKMHFNSAFKHGFDQRLDLPEFHAALTQRKPAALPPHVAVQPRWQPFKDPARIWLNSAVLPVGAVDADMDATYFAEHAEQYLKQPHRKPFFLIVSFYEPHSPFRFPVEDAGRVNPAVFPVPTVGPEDARQIPAVFRDLTPDEKRGIAAAYYTSVEFLDRKIGRVLDALEKSGQAERTLVIYTGDHGYSLGQHGRFEKHTSYEESIRAALLMRYPGVIHAGSATPALVEFIDIVPTVLDLCGLKTPPTVQGKSLVRLLKGQTDKHRARVYVEYALNEEAAVRDGRWKLVFERGKRRRTDGYDPGTPLIPHLVRLYDLVVDPAEMHNVAQVSGNATRVRQMLVLLAEHLKATARQPAVLPKTDDPLELLDFCVQPRDVQPIPAEQSAKRSVAAPSPTEMTELDGQISHLPPSRTPSSQQQLTAKRNPGAIHGPCPAAR